MTNQPTRVGFSTVEYVGAIITIALVGTAIGAVLPHAADWINEQTWPKRYVLADKVADWDSTTTAIVGFLLACVAATIVAKDMFKESFKLTVRDDGIEASADEMSAEIPRAKVHSVFLDGKDLVIQDASSRELLREGFSETTSDRKVRKAFAVHGYPWKQGDPRGDKFVRWIDGSPDVPAALNAVLRARQTVLKSDEIDKNEARELRAEAAKLGYVVRNHGAQQSWRPIGGTKPGGADAP